MYTPRLVFLCQTRLCQHYGKPRLLVPALGLGYLCTGCNKPLTRLERSTTAA